MECTKTVYLAKTCRSATTTATKYSSKLTRNLVEQCTEPEINLSQNFETDESEVREDIQDSEETFTEGLLSMERNQINPTAPNQTISTALIEEVRKYPCI